MARTYAEVIDVVQGLDYAVVSAVLEHQRIAVVDVEFDPSSQKVWEIGAVVMACPPFWSSKVGPRHAGESVRFRMPQTWLIDPVHNTAMSPKKVAKAGLSGAGTFDDHYARLALLLSRQDLLVGYNIGNDRNRLEQELRRRSLPYGEMKWVDVGRMYATLHRLTSVPHLSIACSHYGIPLLADEAHHAFFDALATTQLLRAVCNAWLEQRMSRQDLMISLSGYVANLGWQPSDGVLQPIRVRLPDGCDALRARIMHEDRRLRAWTFDRHTDVGAWRGGGMSAEHVLYRQRRRERLAQTRDPL